MSGAKAHVFLLSFRVSVHVSHLLTIYTNILMCNNIYRFIMKARLSQCVFTPASYLCHIWNMTLDRRRIGCFLLAPGLGALSNSVGQLGFSFIIIFSGSATFPSFECLQRWGEKTSYSQRGGYLELVVLNQATSWISRRLKWQDIKERAGGFGDPLGVATLLQLEAPQQAFWWKGVLIRMGRTTWICRTRS